MACQIPASEIRGSGTDFRVIFLPHPALETAVSGYDQKRLKGDLFLFNFFRSRLLDIKNGKRPASLDELIPDPAS